MYVSSPPQMRRGGAKRRGGADQVNDFLDQHHPSLGLYLGFALSGSRFAAEAFPSSAEEGSFVRKFKVTRQTRVHAAPRRTVLLQSNAGLCGAGALHFH